MESKLKLNQGERLKLEKSKIKGSMGQTDIEHYSIINESD